MAAVGQPVLDDLAGREQRRGIDVSTQTPSNGTARRSDAGGGKRELADPEPSVAQADDVTAHALRRDGRHASIVAPAFATPRNLGWIRALSGTTRERH